MNIFTVITTFLNLALCSYAAFKKDNPTFGQKLAYLKNPTIIIPAPMQVETLMDKDVDYDNYKWCFYRLSRIVSCCYPINS